jgi:hypothetical protein
MKYFICIAILVTTSLLGFSLNNIPFEFSSSPIDVIIPCVEKDLPILELCIKGIKENGHNVRRIIVVSKNRLTNSAEWFDESNYPFSFQDIKNALINNNPKRQKELESTKRTGWYYQQLLKLYTHFTIPNISPNVLILDSDTIFLKPVYFVNEHDAAIFNTHKQYHQPYFDHAVKLVPNFRKVHPRSGITNFMLFQKPVIERLFSSVENLHKKTFWKIFCNLVDTADLSFAGASEYEIYFNFALSCSDQFSIKTLKHRDLRYINSIDRYKKANFDSVSLHAYSRRN